MRLRRHGERGQRARELRIEKREATARGIGPADLIERRSGRFERIAEQRFFGAREQRIHGGRYPVASGLVARREREDREVMIERAVSDRLGEPAILNGEHRLGTEAGE